ncbi:MAG TPA: VWA domain-containing protein, partial [Longimicrobiales bacterium]|nr:VWA domain-containing protein [Longimicrobiales bacterium]
TVAHPGTGTAQKGLLDALTGIRTRGSTNLSGGWLQGRALVHERHLAEGVNRVILLTDGLANVGITDGETLTRLAAEARRAGVSTTTVGVGADFDEDLLAAMADAGGGSAYYIERLDQAGGIFEEEVAGLLSIGAQNLTVTIRPRDAVSVATVHHGYPAENAGDGRLRVAVGDLYAREPRELLADFLVPDGVLAGEGAGSRGPADGSSAFPVADLVVEADVWSPDGSVERRRISLALTFSPEEGAVSHPEVERVFLLLQAARARREAVERGDRGDVAGSVRALRASAVQLQDLADTDLTAREEMRDLYKLAESMEDDTELSPMDRKYMRAKSQHYSRGRRSAGDRTSRD